MSIAVSAIVRPSSGLRRLRMLFCTCVMASALWCDGGLAAALCVASGAAGWLACYGNRSVYRIDISGVGQIRLTLYRKAGRNNAVQENDQLAGLGVGLDVGLSADDNADDNAGVTVRLLAGSTLWPALLLLRLQAEDGPVVSLLIVSDSVARNDYRALALATRAIAARCETLRADGAGSPLK